MGDRSPSLARSSFRSLDAGGRHSRQRKGGNRRGTTAICDAGVRTARMGSVASPSPPFPAAWLSTQCLGSGPTLPPVPLGPVSGPPASWSWSPSLAEAWLICLCWLLNTMCAAGSTGNDEQRDTKYHTNAIMQPTACAGRE